jgi:hypothetical protein
MRPMRLGWLGTAVLLVVLAGCGGTDESAGPATPDPTTSSPSAAEATCHQLFDDPDGPLLRIADFWTSHGATHEEADRITDDIGTIRKTANSAPPELAAPLTVMADETEALVESIGGEGRDKTKFEAAGTEVSGICRPLLS